jgi:hypothetical protein
MPFDYWENRFVSEQEFSQSVIWIIMSMGTLCVGQFHRKALSTVPPPAFVALMLESAILVSL